MPARISITTSQGNTNTNRRLSSPLVSPLPASSSSSSAAAAAAPQLHISRDRNARRHSRHTSWSTGHDLASVSAVTGDSADSAASSSQQRRRRESNLSLASVSERGGGQHNNNDDERDELLQRGADVAFHIYEGTGVGLADAAAEAAGLER